MEIHDYNGPGKWSRDAVIERYESYCRALRTAAAHGLQPREQVEGEVKWIYPVMDEVIPLIERGDPAAIAIGVELVEEDQFMPFGRILKANTARALRRAPLTVEQVERLRFRILRLLRAGTIRREFREYSKLLRRIGPGGEWAEVQQRVDRKNPYVMKYLEYLQRHCPA